MAQTTELQTDWGHMTKGHVVNWLVTLAQKRVVPYARTRFGIIPRQAHEVSIHKSRMRSNQGYMRERNVGWNSCISQY
eukprot:12914754-Prorocentrum_lima.AAC.1